MNRPTEDELRIALMVTRPGADIGPNVACVLKAEILAQRDDLAKLHEDYYQRNAALYAARELVEQSQRAGLANVDVKQLAEALGMKP